MPNWCSNSLDLSHGDKSLIDGLVKELKKEESEIFQYLRPRPTEEDESWYGWNIENWGTKWDANIVDFFETDEGIHIEFDTAWGPPTALYEYLYENDWEVSAQYYEPGMAFVGSFDDGAEIYCEYDFNDENWRDDIPEDLIDYAGLESEYEFWEEMNEEEDPENDD